MELEMSQIEQNLTDYLKGYGKSNQNNLVDVINYGDWQRMAQFELDCRAARLLKSFGEEELQAIASGQVSLPNLATKLTST